MTTAAEPPGSTPGHQPDAHEDAAWVRIDTRLSPADLAHFLDNVERLFRINPLLEFTAFETTGKDAGRLAGRNLSNGRAFATDVEILRGASAVEVRYAHGLKTSTSFRAEPAAAGSCLVVTDIYSGSEDERRARADEVDLSLTAWGRALYDYLHVWARWRWLAPWRWYMRRLWLPMTPSARRIVWMTWVISAVEVAALAALAAILLLLRHAPP